MCFWGYPCFLLPYIHVCLTFFSVFPQMNQCFTFNREEQQDRKVCHIYTQPQFSVYAYEGSLVQDILVLRSVSSIKATGLPVLGYEDVGPAIWRIINHIPGCKSNPTLSASNEKNNNLYYLQCQRRTTSEDYELPKTQITGTQHQHRTLQQQQHTYRVPFFSRDHSRRLTLVDQGASLWKQFNVQELHCNRNLP